MIHYTENKPVGRPAYYSAFHNKAFLGTLDQEVDGYYYWNPGESEGAIAAHILRDLYMKLDHLNMAWDSKVAEGLRGIPASHPELHQFD
jgi:hypothetical protein